MRYILVVTYNALHFGAVPQSLYLTSVLIKFIWSNGGTYSSVLDNVIKSLAGGDVSSSENSISMDASDDEVTVLKGLPSVPALFSSVGYSS